MPFKYILNIILIRILCGSKFRKMVKILDVIIVTIKNLSDLEITDTHLKERKVNT